MGSPRSKPQSTSRALSRPASRSRPSAFTLTELLVVIGVIGVIVGILLTALSRARRQARIVECCANLRSIGQACTQHAAATDGYLPLAGLVSANPNTRLNNYPAGLDDGGRAKYTYIPSPSAPITVTVVPFIAALAPYLGVDSLPKDNWDTMDQALNSRDGVWRRFMCPDTDALTRGKYNSDPNDHNVVGQGTMMVCAIGDSPVTAWATNSDYAINEGVFGYHYDGQYVRNRLGGNTRRLAHPDQTVLFTDGGPRKLPAVPIIPLGWICWTPTLDGTGPATLADALSGAGRVDGPDTFDRNRHGKRMNVLFADGHVETFPITPEALGRAYLVAPQ